MAKVVVVQVLPDGRKFYLANQAPPTWVKSRELALVFDAEQLADRRMLRALVERYEATTEPHDSP